MTLRAYHDNDTEDIRICKQEMRQKRMRYSSK